MELKASVDKLYTRLDKTYDTRYGGFGAAPKFPSPSQTLHFLARYAALGPDKAKAERSRDMAVETLTSMYNGGIRDVVGEGFSRYSVDEKWHVPHCKPFGITILHLYLIKLPSRENAVRQRPASHKLARAGKAHEFLLVATNPF